MKKSEQEICPRSTLRGQSSRPASTRHDHSAPRLAPAGIFYLIGLTGGMFGGLLGIGGGSAIAPLLLLTSKLRPAQVSGTTLATVLLISTVGSGAYATLGHLNLSLAWPIAMGSVSGSVLGALMAKRLSMGLMIALFLIILPYFVVKELWPSFAAPAFSTGLMPLVILGLGTGFFSGLLGISGASLVVPSLVGFFLIDHHAAQGIAISVALADSLAGTATHARAGNINYRVLLYLAAPAALAALAGAFLSNSLPSGVLRYLYVLLMVAVCLTMVMRLIRDRAGRPETSRVTGCGAADMPEHLMESTNGDKGRHR